MASNSETVQLTVYRQMPWAGNIAKTMTSNGKHFTVTREMFTVVEERAADRCFSFLLYDKSLNDWSRRKQWISFPSILNVPRDEVKGNIEILGKQNSLFPSEPDIKSFKLL